MAYPGFKTTRQAFSSINTHALGSLLVLVLHLESPILFLLPSNPVSFQSSIPIPLSLQSISHVPHSICLLPFSEYPIPIAYMVSIKKKSILFILSSHCFSVYVVTPSTLQVSSVKNLYLPIFASSLILSIGLVIY